MFASTGRCDDLNIVPIAINYEKTMESDLYSNELLGDSKIQESLRSLLRSASSVLSMKFGGIGVVFEEPISLKKYAEDLAKRMNQPKPDARGQAVENSMLSLISLADMSEYPGARSKGSPSGHRDTPLHFDPRAQKQDRRELVRRLSYSIVYHLNRASECMPTHLVATLMLMYRQVCSAHLCKCKMFLPVLRLCVSCLNDDGT